MKLYLIRHGETLFNQKHRIQGWCDSPLSEKGIAQAIAVGKGIQEIPFVAAYSSTSERAIDTAHYILQERKLSITSLKGLKEMNFGSIEGEYEKDYLALDGSTHDKGFVGYGGETLAMTSQRIIDTLIKIAKKHPEGNVLVVSHGGAIMCALQGISKVNIKKFRDGTYTMENCSVSIIDYDTTLQVETIGDTKYREKGKELKNGI